MPIYENQFEARFGYILDFNLLNSFAHKNAGIYDKLIFEKVDKVRKLRNQIHLMKLENKECSKSELNETFQLARELFKIIENKLKVS